MFGCRVGFTIPQGQPREEIVDAIWITAKGAKYPISEMTDDHLENVAKVLYDHRLKSDSDEMLGPLQRAGSVVQHARSITMPEAKFSLIMQEIARRNLSIHPILYATWRRVDPAATQVGSRAFVEQQQSRIHRCGETVMPNSYRVHIAQQDIKELDKILAAKIKNKDIFLKGLFKSPRAARRASRIASISLS